MTDAEAQEALHTAMTVGATRMQVMMAQETAALGTPDDGPDRAPSAARAGADAGGPGAPSGEAGAASPATDAQAPAFAAAQVVEQAGST